MKTLRAYGDSFLSNGLGWEGKSLTTLLGEKLNVPVINKAIAGSSTEYAFIQLTNDIKNKSIDSNDVIIFNTTFPGRLNLEFQNHTRPETAALDLRKPGLFDMLNNSKNSKDHSWYFKNQKHIEWYMVNQDYNLKLLNIEAYTHTIKDFAYTMPNVTFVVLHNLEFEFAIPGNAFPKNFLHSNISLWQISKNEFTNKNTELGQDPRINHCCIPNLHILSDMLIDAIDQFNITSLTYDKFKQKFIDPIVSLKQYEDYISKGYLYYHADSVNKLKSL